MPLRYCVYYCVLYCTVLYWGSRAISTRANFNRPTPSHNLVLSISTGCPDAAESRHQFQPGSKIGSELTVRRLPATPRRYVGRGVGPAAPRRFFRPARPVFRSFYSIFTQFEIFLSAIEWRQFQQACSEVRSRVCQFQPGIPS